ncbi:MAG: DNA polymerase I [Defluviitaleaceae bacterium]|nr:DNA polymerase I [Defluviitaleaceae bacterium]
MENKKLMLLDGLSLINRAFYALPPLTTKEGLPTNAIIGFLNIMLKLIDEETPEYVAVAFDLPAPTFRHKQYEEYKATRKSFPDELKQQIPMLKELLKAMDVAIVQEEGYEADDIMGTLATYAETVGYEVAVVTGDRDLLQIVTDRIKVRIPKTSKGQTTTEDYYAADFVEKMGITPREYIDMKALMGDASDNIPGVPSIGEKTALKIIMEHSNIETAIANVDNIKPPRAAQNLRDFADQARLSKELATIMLDAKIDADISKLLLGDIMNPDALTEFRRLELKSMLKRAQAAGKSIDATPVGSTLGRQATQGRIINLNEWNSFLSGIGEGATCFYRLSIENGEIVGIAAQYDDNLVYLPNTSNSDFFAAIIPFFESDCKVVAFDAKKDINLLRRHGVTKYNLAFDLLLAGYLLNNVKDGDNLNDVSLEYLGSGIAMTYASEAQISLLDEPIDNTQEAAEAAFAQITVITQVYPIMIEALGEQNLNSLYYEVELPLLHVLADMECLGVRCDGEFIRDYGSKLTTVIDRLTAEIHNMAGSEFNINSTKQLAKVLFEDMGIRSIKKTKTGHSTNVEVLEKLAREHEIAQKILEYRSHTKLRSTYVDGLLAVIGEDGKIHTTFNQATAATGRLSSVEPNLQNIPVRTLLGRELRRAFVPSEGFVFVDADYSQIELRVLAHLSQDETFVEAFKQNQDVHRITAARVFHVPFDDVTDEMRRIAKAVNFGIVYGISAFSLADDIKVSVREADGFIENYFVRYPDVKRYIDTAVADAKQKGYAETIFGRRRNIPELAQANFNTRSFGERAAMNMPVQGTAADIIKIAMIKVHNRLVKEELESRLILQVHDELLIEAKPDEVDKVKDILMDEMENAVSLSVPLSIDISTGKSWYDAK